MSKYSFKDKCMDVFRANPNKWLPVWHFIGEVYSVRGYVFLSHRCPARVSELHEERSDITRRSAIGKSGARYYEYMYITN